jgi:hypothetical protein
MAAARFESGCSFWRRESKDRDPFFARGTPVRESAIRGSKLNPLIVLLLPSRHNEISSSA